MKTGFFATRYRVKKRGIAYTPQKKVLWWWVNIGKRVGTIEAAREIIRQHEEPLPQTSKEQI
jgi:hypothetical protein